MSQKILIIEDQKEIVKLLTQRLKSLGFTIVAAYDGDSGLQMVADENPDLIISDLAMPGTAGNIVVRKLKTDDKTKNIPIIMLSAFVNPNMTKSLEVPADCYITKPFEAEFLVQKVNELLGN